MGNAILRGNAILGGCHFEGGGCHFEGGAFVRCAVCRDNATLRGGRLETSYIETP